MRVLGEMIMLLLMGAGILVILKLIRSIFRKVKYSRVKPRELFDAHH